MRRTLFFALFASLVLAMPAQAQRPARRGFAQQRPSVQRPAQGFRPAFRRPPVIVQQPAPLRRPGFLGRLFGVFRGGR